MAIFHLSVKAIGRASGRSATAAAAYRAATRIEDQRTGLVHDYSRKSGVVHREIVVPDDAPVWARDRERLWNAAELAETRKNSTVAREFEVALPGELAAEERRRLACTLAAEIATRHRCAVDIAIHAPARGGDDRNHHAHLLLTTRRLEAQGFTAKTRELDDLKTGEVTRWRERWATLVNEHLAERGHAARVDHRSLKDQGIDREPATHLGPAVTGMQRRGMETEVGRRIQAEAQARLERTAELGRLERESAAIGQSILVLDGDIRRALQEREALQRAAAPAQSRPYDREEAQRVAREKWLEYRDRQAREEKRAGQEQGATSERTATYDREAAQRAAIERWLEYREQQAGKGKDAGLSQSPGQEPEKGGELSRGKGKGRDIPDDDFSL